MIKSSISWFKNIFTNKPPKQSGFDILCDKLSNTTEREEEEEEFLAAQKAIDAFIEILNTYEGEIKICQLEHENFLDAAVAYYKVYDKVGSTNQQHIKMCRNMMNFIIGSLMSDKVKDRNYYLSVLMQIGLRELHSTLKHNKN